MLVIKRATELEVRSKSRLVQHAIRVSAHSTNTPSLKRMVRVQNKGLHNLLSTFFHTTTTLITGATDGVLHHCAFVRHRVPVILTVGLEMSNLEQTVCGREELCTPQLRFNLSILRQYSRVPYQAGGSESAPPGEGEKVVPVQ